MTNLFLCVLILCTVSATQRLPSDPDAEAPAEDEDEEGESAKTSALYDNRRQADFHILLLTLGLGMSLMAKSTHLFMLFVCLELASLSSYVLVGFHKETKAGGEAGTKYFIVGSVASAIGIYGMSLLYLWQGDLSVSGLAQSWQSMETIDPLAAAGVGMMIVAFGFKVGAAPFHLAIPDAYSGTSSMVAGVLATASKAMGFVALMRLLLTIAMPATGPAFWYGALAVISVVTMTWGNLAALSSDNPKRVLAYSSVAHAGYMLAAVSAIGSGLADGPRLGDDSGGSALPPLRAGAVQDGPVHGALRDREGGREPQGGRAERAGQQGPADGRVHVRVHALPGRGPAFLRVPLQAADAQRDSDRVRRDGGAELPTLLGHQRGTGVLAGGRDRAEQRTLDILLPQDGDGDVLRAQRGREGSPCNPVIRTLIVSLAVLSLAFGIGPPSEWLLGLAEDAAAALLA